LPSTDHSSLDLALRQSVYDHTLRHGRPPSSVELAAALGSTPNEVVAGLRRLAEAHVLVLQPERGEILMAAPFSAVPTPFPLTTSRQAYYGNCIWDALGAAAMLNEDAVITTACGCCGYSLALTIRAGALSAPPSLVHFALPAARWWDDIVFT
jgi:hypothetical protein